MEKIFTVSNMKKAGACLVVGVIAFGGFNWFQHYQMKRDFQRVAEARTHMVEQEAAKNDVTLMDKAQIKSIAADAMGIDETAISWDSISLSNGPEGMFMMMNGHPGMPGHRGMMPETLCGPANSYDCPGGQGNHWGRGGNWDRDNHWDRGNGPYGGPRGGHHYQEDQGRHHRQFSGASAENGTDFNPDSVRENGWSMPQVPDNNWDNKSNAAETAVNNETKQDDNKKKDNPFQFHPVYNVICEANDVRYFLHIDAVNGHVFKCNVGRK